MPEPTAIRAADASIRLRWARVVAVGMLLAALVACAGTRSSVCGAYSTLHDAVDVMNDAQGADDDIRLQIEEVDGLVRSARRQLTSVEDTRTAPAARAILEAANYLEYMVGQYRDTGTVDFSITQFASRELTRALSGAGGPHLNC